MDRSALFALLLTKRGVVAFVTAMAVLGAGFGFVSPVLDGPPSGDASGGSPATTAETMTATTLGETAADATTSSDGTSESRTTDETATTSDGTEETVVGDESPTTAATTAAAESNADPSSNSGDDSGDSSDDSSADSTDDNPDDSSDDDPASVGVRAESNATVSSLPNYPSNSLTLNAVVNAPNTANTAGGA